MEDTAGTQAQSQRPPWPVCLAACTLVALACFVADFLQVTQFGLLVDDWTLLGDMLWNKHQSSGEFISTLFFESWEARPLRAVEHALLLGGYKVAGIPGAFMVLWAVLSLNAILFGSLVARRFPWTVAVFVSLFFLLHPADTTHAWAATLMAKLGLLYCLLACHLFVRGRSIAAFILCCACLTSYELSVFPFVLAPWFADGGTRRSLIRAAKILGAALGLYVLWRLVIFPNIVPDARVGMIREGLGLDVAWVWLRSFPDTLRFAFWDWPGQFVLPALAGVKIWATFGGVLVFGTAGFLARRWKLNLFPLPEPPACLKAVLFGVVGVLAAASLGFFTRPTDSIGVESRVNYFFTPGAVIAFTGAGLLLLQFLPRKAATLLGVSLGTLILATQLGFRYHVQRDYAWAAESQKVILREAITTLGPLPPQTMVGLIHVPKPHEGARAIHPFLTGWNWDLERCFELIYDKGISAIALADANDYMRAIGGMVNDENLTRIREKLKAHNIVFYDVRTGGTHWLQKNPQADKLPPVIPQGDAYDFIFR